MDAFRLSWTVFDLILWHHHLCHFDICQIYFWPQTDIKVLATAYFFLRNALKMKVEQGEWVIRQEKMIYWTKIFIDWLPLIFKNKFYLSLQCFPKILYFSPFPVQQIHGYTVYAEIPVSYLFYFLLYPKWRINLRKGIVQEVI